MLILSLGLLALTGTSAYGLYISYGCITRLRQYEAQTEQAARYSNTAAERLHKTRTTQGSAAITIALSLLTSIGLLAVTHPETSSINLGIALVNTAITAAARYHVKNFWSDKAKVPFVEGYNEAISGTDTLAFVLGLLVPGWGFVLGFEGWSKWMYG